MAKQRFGINDAYRGSVGTVIGYQWRGQWCLRAKPRFVKNPLHMRAGFDDEVRLMALCPEENEMMMSGSVPRRGKSISITLPAH